MLLTDLTSRALLLAQASLPVTGLSFGQIAQYAANLAAVGAFVFAWRTNTRVTRIETVLMEPKFGAVDRLEGHGTTIGEHGTKLAEHETRLDGHDREFSNIRKQDAIYPAPRAPEHKR